MDTNSDVPVIRERDKEFDKDPPIDDGRFLYKIPEFLDTELTLLSRFTATVGVWTSCAILFITSLLFIVAFSITKWGIVTSRINGDVIEYGLWQACDVSSGDCWFLVGEPSTTTAYQVCQAFASLSMASMLLSVLPLMIYCAYPDLQDVRTLRVVTLFSRLTTATFLLVTFAVYSNTWYKPLYDNPDHVTRLSHSHHLTVAAFSFECFASLLVLMAMRSKALEVRLKHEQAIQEARDRVIAHSYYDEATHEADLEFENAHQVPAMSPYEAFRRYSAMDSTNEYDANVNSHQPSYSNAAYSSNTDEQYGDSYMPQDNEKHVIRAEINAPQGNRYIVGAEAENYDASNGKAELPNKTVEVQYKQKYNDNHHYGANERHRDTSGSHTPHDSQAIGHIRYSNKPSDNAQYPSPNMGLPRSVENVPDGSSDPPTPRAERANEQPSYSHASHMRSSGVEQIPVNSGAVPKDPKRRSKRQKKKAHVVHGTSRTDYSDMNAPNTSMSRYDSGNVNQSRRRDFSKHYIDDPNHSYTDNLDMNRKGYHGSHVDLHTPELQLSPSPLPHANAFKKSQSDRPASGSEYLKGTAI